VEEKQMVEEEDYIGLGRRRGGGNGGSGEI
jgi:hypothetical protein